MAPARPRPLGPLPCLPPCRRRARRGSRWPPQPRPGRARTRGRAPPPPPGRRAAPPAAGGGTGGGGVPAGHPLGPAGDGEGLGEVRSEPAVQQPASTVCWAVGWCLAMEGCQEGMGSAWTGRDPPGRGGKTIFAHRLAKLVWRALKQE